MWSRYNEWKFKIYMRNTCMEYFNENISRINTCSCKSRYFEIWKSDIKIGVPHIVK